VVLEMLFFPLLLVSSAVLVMRSRFVSLCAGDKLETLHAICYVRPEIRGEDFV